MKHSDFLSRHKAELLYTLIIAVCAIPNIALSITEQLSFAGRLTNIFLPLGIYLILGALSRKIGRTGCWMFILMFFAAFQIVLLYLYGRSVIAVDMFLNLVTTNPEEVGELLGNMLPIVALVAIIYLPVLVLSIFAIAKKWRLNQPFIIFARRIGIVSIVIGAISGLTAVCSPKGFNPISDLYPANVAENIAIAINRTAKSSAYESTSANMTYHAAATYPSLDKEIYVAVIGETSRAPQWHVFGYSLPTTAPIDTIEGIIGFPKTVSESNTTHKSVPMLLTSLDAAQFEDSIYSHKGIITAFKEAGFTTAFISNQARNHSFIDFLGQEADSVLFINDNTPIGQHQFDMRLLDVLDDMIKSNQARKQFYVIHTYGSHFSYSDRYPSGSQPFMPDSPVEVKGDNHDRLTNAYDNTIHYTASLLARLTDILKSTDALSGFLYTSDHGEDIFDDSRRLFLHASPIPSYWQLHVPMILWLSESYNTSFPDAAINARANASMRVSSSAAFFNTIVAMAGISTPYLDETRALTSGRFSEHPAIYLNDHNQAVALRDCGLQRQDFEEFKNAGISL